MKNKCLFLLLLILIPSIINLAQSSKRIAETKIAEKQFITESFPFYSPQETNASFATTIYTFGDITIFSYFDNTSITVYDANGAIKGTKILNTDKNYTFRYGSGIFRIVGNKTYTVLVGDAITSYVNGYFAVDEAGRGLSTKLNTWMMSTYGTGSDFIVFAYNDNTGFTVKDSTGKILAAGTLNTGQHYSFAQAGTIPAKQALQVTGTKPVSALSYTDQDYYVPSSNGTFVGTTFYGYSARVGGWDNCILVTSYSDNNSVTITNSTTGATIKTYTLQKGQVAAENITTPTFWTVKTSGSASAANIPFTYATSGYQYMTRAIDETGKGFGKLFYVPTIGSNIHIFSFDNANKIKVTQMGDYTAFPYTAPTVKYEGTLDEGKYYNFISATGRYVYKIEASGNVSVLQSNAGAGADFMPLAYSLDYADLAVSTDDIKYNKADNTIVAGDLITVTVTVHNYGSVAASNVVCYAFDGDPDAGGSAPIIGNGTIANIPVNGTGTFSFNYKVPTSPEYHTIVVKADANNSITESNESNNKAQRGVKPNTDLQPPLAINVTAPSNLLLQNGVLIPNPFTVKYEIFNTGTVAATNVVATLELFNGLTLASGTLVRNIGSINGNYTATVEYQINANKNISGFNFYKLTVTCTNADTKIINRAVNVPDATAPNAPANFTGQVVSNINASLTWNNNSESDLAGYYLYYSTDGVNWNGKGASQGDSPILIVNDNKATITGLPVTEAGINYWFMLRAFDSSNNLSSNSASVKLLLKSGTSSTSTVIFYGNTPKTWTVKSPDTGFVIGPNSYGDLGKYQKFDFTGDLFLKQARIYFSSKEIVGSADNLTFVVRDVNSTSGGPGILYYSSNFSTNSIDISNPGNVFNTITISTPFRVTKPFFIGLEWTSSIDDKFNILADAVGEGEMKKRAWEKWSDGTFHDMHGSWQDFDIDLWISAVLSTTSPVKDNNNSIPTEFVLYQNYPNPFNPFTKISYSLPKSGFVDLRVFDILGNEVSLLIKSEQQAGIHNVEFNGASLSSGVYIYKLTFNGQSYAKKLILMK